MSKFFDLLFWSIICLSCTNEIGEKHDVLHQHKGQWCLRTVYVGDEPIKSDIWEDNRKYCYKCDIYSTWDSSLPMKDIIDVESFEFAGSSGRFLYYKDKNNVYEWGQMAYCGGVVYLLEGANPKTFIVPDN